MEPQNKQPEFINCDLPPASEDMAQRKRGLCLHVKPGNLTPSWDISKVSPQAKIQTNQKHLANSL